MSREFNDVSVEALQEENAIIKAEGAKVVTDLIMSGAGVSDAVIATTGNYPSAAYDAGQSRANMAQNIAQGMDIGAELANMGIMNTNLSQEQNMQR